MRNVLTDGTYVYITLRTGVYYRLQRRLISDGTIGAGCWDVDIFAYCDNNGFSSMCMDAGAIYICSATTSQVAKFDISNGSNLWNQSYSPDQYYKIRQYGSYVYVCGINNTTFKPIIEQLNKSDGSIFHTFEGSPDFSAITAMDIDSTGIFISQYDSTDPMTIPVRVIYRKLSFSWVEAWNTPVSAPGPAATYNDINTNTLKVGSTELIAVGYETEVVDPDLFARGRRDTLDKTTGLLTDTEFWSDTFYYCNMKGVDTQGSDIFTGGYKTVPISDPNYNPDNSRWIMTKGNPIVG
jgi:hypothetical protein